MSKVKNLNLQNSISSSYDKTKTTYAGRVSQTTKEGQLVLGPPLTKFADVFTAYGVAPGHCVINPTTGRKFELQNVNTNVPQVLAFTFDINTGDWVYIGKITMTLPPGTHTYRGFNVDDSNSSNIRVYVTSTVTTTTCLGGVYSARNLLLSDFTPVGTTILPSSSVTAGQKAVYFSQYASQVGQQHTGTASGGVALGLYTSASPANQTKYFMQNGTATTLQIYGFDSALGSSAVAGLVTNGISAQTSPYAGTSPSAYFTMGASQNGYSTVANTAAAFEAVIVQNGTGNVPANFTSTAPATAQTVYFLRDLQLVGGQWYFNLSTTSTGAAVVPTSSVSSFTMMRAYGISTTHSVFKTGNITPSLTGTLLLNQTFGATTPVNVPAGPTLNNSDCLQLATTSNLYLGKISDLADGSSSWSSLVGVNALGTGVDIVAPSISTADYSSVLDRWVFVSNTSKFYIKPHQNNIIEKAMGSLVTKYYEGQNPVAVQPGLAALVTIKLGQGWLFMTGSTTGQRGVVAVDLYSDEMFDNSYIISPITQVEPGSILRYVSSVESYWDYTDNVDVYLRSASTASDAIFNTASGGWTQVDYSKDNFPTAIGPYFQVKVKFNIATDQQGCPAQINDIIVAYTSSQELSEYWAGDVDNTTANGITPSRTAFYLTKQYSSTVPTLYFRAYDASGNLVVSANTSANASLFEYSTNGGTSWNSLGTIPNTAGTIVRYNWASPPGVNVFVSLRES